MSNDSRSKSMQSFSVNKHARLKQITFGLSLLLAVFCLLHATRPAAASDPGKGDWPMWGGTADRNMVSSMKGLPTSWDVKTKKNVKWVSTLGSQSYGNPVVAGGQVYVGTNNEGVRDPNVKGDKGIGSEEHTSALPSRS